MIGRTNTAIGNNFFSKNKAVIHIMAPIGSTITFSKDNIIVKILGPEKSHVNTDDNTFADWYYAVSSSNYGTWTVTATLGTGTVSDTVTIDNNKQYDVGPIHYPFFLYDSGNQHVDVTGGWQFKSYAQASSASVTFGETAIDINPTNQYSCCVGTISMSGNVIASYSTLKAELQVLSTGGDSRVGIVPNYSLGSSGIDNKWTAVKIYTTTGTFTASINISALTTGYVLLASWKQRTKFSKIWLER